MAKTTVQLLNDLDAAVAAVGAARTAMEQADTAAQTAHKTYDQKVAAAENLQRTLEDQISSLLPAVTNPTRVRQG